MGVPPKHDRPSNSHDRVVSYASFYKDEIGIDLEEQVEAARKDAEEHDATIVAEIAECVPRTEPILKRSGLLQAIRYVRGLGRRGVLLLGAPGQVGSLLDRAVVIALVEDAGGGVASIHPLTRDRVEHFQLIEAVDAMKRFAEQCAKFRQSDDVFALRRTMSWPLSPGGQDDG